MREYISPAQLELRSESERILSMRIAPFGVMGRTSAGLEVIAPGAFAHVNPTAVVLRQDHTDPPAGRGISLEERADGAHMDFQVARTPRGDELLANVAEGMHRNASIGFDPAGSESVARAWRGQPVTMHRRLDLREVSTTWRPVYAEAGELAVRMEDLGMPETEPQPTPEPTPVPTPAPEPQQLAGLRARIAELEERARSSAIALPSFGPAARSAAVSRGAWVQLALRSLAGERVDLAELRAILPAQMAERAIADVTTTGNLGVVPEQFRTEIIGEINRSRPFLESTREVPAGTAGLTFNFPKITTRPLTGIQSAEKGDLASGATAIGVVPFEAISIGGVGDLSLQLLRRSSPQFLTLWLDLLQESYAINADDSAVDALLAESTVVEGGTLDPVSPTFGGAFTNAMAVAPGGSLLPDRLWLSTAALAAFIDAKEPAGGGGRPLYPGLATISGMTDGPGGPLPIRLRPVHVPALDDEAVDVIIGPSRGFAWAEDGTYTLSADVPTKGGRDVGLLGMLWFMPIYPAAFTTYTLPVVVP